MLWGGLDGLFYIYYLWVEREYNLSGQISIGFVALALREHFGMACARIWNGVLVQGIIVGNEQYLE